MLLNSISICCDKNVYLFNNYLCFSPGVEKKNDDYTRYFHRKIDRWDACTNLLLVEKRQESLLAHQRKPRQYLKRDATFWNNGGKEEVAKKYPKISEGTATEEPSRNVHVPPPKQVLQFGEKELQKLKVAELVKLLVDIVGHQPSLPKKPRKHELLSRIFNVAALRVD